MKTLYGLTLWLVGIAAIVIALFAIFYMPNAHAVNVEKVTKTYSSTCPETHPNGLFIWGFDTKCYSAVLGTQVLPNPATDELVVTVSVECNFDEQLYGVSGVPSYVEGQCVTNTLSSNYRSRQATLSVQPSAVGHFRQSKIMLLISNVCVFLFALSFGWSISGRATLGELT